MICRPEKIRVLGHWYTVRDLDAKYKINGRPIFDGVCDFDSCDIQIKQGMCESQERLIVFHEITHAVDHELRGCASENIELIGRRLSELNEQLLTEGDVKMISCGLFSVLTDPSNSGLSEWLFGWHPLLERSRP